MLLVDGTLVFGIIVEAQLGSDPEKRFIWPMYVVSARARYRCPVVVLVATPDAATARRAAEPVDLGADTLWRSLVVGPEGIPGRRYRRPRAASRGAFRPSRTAQRAGKSE